MALIGEATGQGDLGQAEIAGTEEVLGAFDPPFDQPAVRRKACGLPERAGEVLGTEPNQGGEFFKGKVVMGVLIHRFHNAAKLIRPSISRLVGGSRAFKAR